MCNKTILGAPFVGEFCVYGLQSVKPDTCFDKVHFQTSER